MKLDKRWTPTPENMLEAFCNWYNESIHDYDVPEIERWDTYVVWFCYTLGNAKALISTTRHDHAYFELTWHSDKNQLHVDQYLKVKHDDVDRLK